MRVKCEVFRFDPDSGEKSRFDTYSLEVDSKETVLGVLREINHKFDSTLSFRFACGVVKCGECALMVNGSPCLSCEKLVEPEMKIEPLPNLPLVKDLVIDRNQVFERIWKLLPRLPELENKSCNLFLDPETADRFVNLTNCFECLICQSACPVYDKDDEFVGPLGILWCAQMNLIMRTKQIPGSWDQGKSMLDSCLKCGMCSDVCRCSQDVISIALETLESE